MTAEIRYKGRGMIIGAVGLFTLIFFVGALLVYSVNLLPLLYRGLIEPAAEEKFGQFSAYIGLAAAFLVLMLVFFCYNAFSLGSSRYAFKRAQRLSADTGDIFCYFSPKRLPGVTALTLRLFLLRLMLLLFCLLPLFIVATLVYFLTQNVASAGVIMIMALSSAAFLISAIYFYMRLSASLFLVRYIFIRGDYLNFRHLISYSQQQMRGRAGELMSLRLSFLPWFFLCLLIFPIGYVFAYYKQTLACYAHRVLSL